MDQLQDGGDSVFTTIEKLMQALSCVATLGTFLRVIFEQVSREQKLHVV